jgi:nucleoside-diphosphate-sugar epimerase
MTQRMKVLVTGATGKQGGAILRRLREKGHAVRALTRSADSVAAKALVANGASNLPFTPSKRGELCISTGSELCVDGGVAQV